MRYWVSFCSRNTSLVKTINLVTVNILKLLKKLKYCLDFCLKRSLYIKNVSMNFILKSPKADIFEI